VDQKNRNQIFSVSAETDARYSAFHRNQSKSAFVVICSTETEIWSISGKLSHFWHFSFLSRLLDRLNLPLLFIHVSFKLNDVVLRSLIQTKHLFRTNLYCNFSWTN